MSNAEIIKEIRVLAEKIRKEAEDSDVGTDFFTELTGIADSGAYNLDVDEE